MMSWVGHAAGGGVTWLRWLEHVRPSQGQVVMVMVCKRGKAVCQSAFAKGCLVLRTGAEKSAVCNHNVVCTGSAVGGCDSIPCCLRALGLC